MNQTREFIQKHFGPYLELSRRKNEGKHMPPKASEIEDLISYLKQHNADPVIIGSMAVVYHLKDEAFQREFRPTRDIDIFVLDIFVSNPLLRPPINWKQDKDSVGVISWISPNGGYVDFLVAGHHFPDNHQVPQEIQKDPESTRMGCPIANPISVFLLKLNSVREKDLTDLVLLAKMVGIPKNLESKRLNTTQRENLELVKLWITV